MAELKRSRPHALPFRLLLIVAGVFVLAAAFAPRVHAQSVIAYFNFEDGSLGNIDFTSDTIGPPDNNPGGGAVLTTMTTTYNPANMTNAPGLLLIELLVILTTQTQV